MKTESFPTLAGAPEEENLKYNIENLGQLKIRNNRQQHRMVDGRFGQTAVEELTKKR